MRKIIVLPLFSSCLFVAACGMTEGPKPNPDITYRAAIIQAKANSIVLSNAALRDSKYNRTVIPHSSSRGFIPEQNVVYTIGKHLDSQNRSLIREQHKIIRHEADHSWCLNTSHANDHVNLSTSANTANVGSFEKEAQLRPPLERQELDAELVRQREESQRLRAECEVLRQRSDELIAAVKEIPNQNQVANASDATARQAIGTIRTQLDNVSVRLKTIETKCSAIPSSNKPNEDLMKTAITTTSSSVTNAIPKTTFNTTINDNGKLSH